MPHTTGRIARIAVIGFFLSATLSWSGDQPQPIRSAQDVIRQWTPQQHLFVKGNVGVGRDQLSGLERWLDEHAPHWVVVLLQSADGERYTSPDGQVYHGMDAVEYALGRGLANQTDFGQWVDDTTGETNGAVFALFLEERKFSYYGSDVHDRRGLGESHWINELDRPAFRAMRGGGRILDAVKDTITNINDRLASVLQREQADAAQRARERQRQLDAAQAKIDALRDEVALVNTAAEALASRYPEATGELRSPPCDAWSEQLDALSGELSPTNVAATRLDLDSLDDRIAEYRNAYALAEVVSQRVAEFREATLALRRDGLPAAKPMVDEAELGIAQLEKDRTEGRIAILKHFESVRQALASGQAAAAEQRESRQQAAERRQLLRRAAAATAAVLMLAAGGGLVFLNRRRRPLRDQARQAYAAQKKLVDREVDSVFELFEHSNEVLGSRERLVDRGYEGQTRRLAEQTFDNVDDLIVMSREVERVMAEAGELIHPRHWWGRLVNLFSGHSFERGQERISGKPLEFRSDYGLPNAMQAPRPEAGVDAEPPVVRLTFDEVFRNFDERTDQATALLDRIEQCLLDVNDRLGALAIELESLEQLDHQVTQRAEQQECFSVPNFFGVLIPAAYAAYDAADARMLVDPVAAVEEHIATGEQRVRLGRRLSEILLDAHEHLRPQLLEWAPQLEDRGYRTVWLDERLDALSLRADELYAIASRQDAAAEIETFAGTLNALRERTQQAIHLAELVDGELTQSLEALAQRIRSDRQTLAERLRLPAVSVLHEHDHDPDEEITAARQQREGMRVALERGNVSAANEALGILRQAAQRAHQILDDSLEAERSFATTSRELASVHQAAESHGRLLAETVQMTQQTYAEAAWQLVLAEDGAEDVQSLGDVLAAATASLDEVQRLLGRARTFHSEGRVLEGAAVLDEVKNQLVRVETRQRSIEAHVARLEAQERENQVAWESLVRRAEQERTRVEDDRTRHSTIEAYRAWFEELQRTGHRLEKRSEERGEARSPFAVADHLAELEQRAAQVWAQVDADWETHAQTVRAVQAAEAEQMAAQRLVERARRDGIPDSQVTTAAIREIEHHAEDIRSLHAATKHPQGDWPEVHTRANAILKALATSAGRLRGELDQAQRVASQLEQASHEVFQASKWTGGWGIRITGGPGTHELDRAREALQGGRYAAVAELSRMATIAAQQAVHRAQREVARREAEARRRAEAARRRQSFNASPSRSGGSIRVGGGGGVSSQRSTSGFSRSGW